jgi:hypothetical protein
MVTKSDSRMPPWAASYLKVRKPPTKEELRAREKAFRHALKIREQLDIRPLTTGELIRSLRDERE